MLGIHVSYIAGYPVATDVKILYCCRYILILCINVGTRTFNSVETTFFITVITQKSLKTCGKCIGKYLRYFINIPFLEGNVWNLNLNTVSNHFSLRQFAPRTKEKKVIIVQRQIWRNNS